MSMTCPCLKDPKSSPHHDLEVVERPTWALSASRVEGVASKLLSPDRRLYTSAENSKLRFATGKGERKSGGGTFGSFRVTSIRPRHSGNSSVLRARTTFGTQHLLHSFLKGLLQPLKLVSLCILFLLRPLHGWRSGSAKATNAINGSWMKAS
mmetsp:Transcript_23567/g.42569  ORF Transcript_23567/g.42569 Transcript_23567/m.42569 type:complete len:152 (+) Transcript_23567:94-549(+)